jgi:hypothetical protein
MAKFDLDALSIEELAKLRDNVNAKLLEKVATRQLELEAEMERLSEYGKPAKKTLTAPAAPKARKTEGKVDRTIGEAMEAQLQVAETVAAAA